MFFFIGFGPRHVHEQHSRTPEKYFIAYWGPLESFLTEKLEEIWNWRFYALCCENCHLSLVSGPVTSIKIITEHYWSVSFTPGCLWDHLKSNICESFEVEELTHFRAIFTGFGPRRAAGLAERPNFSFAIIIYHPKEHSLWFSALNSKISLRKIWSLKRPLRKKSELKAETRRECSLGW